MRLSPCQWAQKAAKATKTAAGATAVIEALVFSYVCLSVPVVLSACVAMGALAGIVIRVIFWSSPGDEK
jgi:hypothetical protein